MNNGGNLNWICDWDCDHMFDNNVRNWCDD